MNVPLDCINLVQPKIKLLIWRTAQYHQQKERKFYSIVNIYFHIKTEDPINWFDWHDFLSCVDVFPIETGGLGTTYFIFNYVTSMSNHSLFGYSTTGGGEFSFHTTSDWKTIWAAQKRSSIFLAHFPRSERLFYISREQKNNPYPNCIQALKRKSAHTT